MDLAVQLATRGQWPDAKHVLAVALRDVVNLHAFRRPTEFEQCLKTIAHCLAHLPMNDSLEEFIPALIRTHNKLLDKNELKPTVLYLHLVLRSAMLHFQSSGPDAALADLNRKAQKSFGKHAEVAKLKFDLASLTNSTSISQTLPSAEVRLWQDAYETGHLPIGLNGILDLAASARIELPEAVWLEALFMSNSSVTSILAKRRRSEGRFNWTWADFSLVLTAIESAADSASRTPLFQLLLNHLDRPAELTCWTPERVQVWLGLFWRGRAVRGLLQSGDADDVFSAMAAAAILTVSHQVEVPADTREAAAKLVTGASGEVAEFVKRGLLMTS